MRAGSRSPDPFELARKLAISESVVRMSGPPYPCGVFDRYNIVDERNLREAVRVRKKLDAFWQWPFPGSEDVKALPSKSR
jgi:hypothetical protein